MVRTALEDGEGAIELFQEQDPAQVMGKGHWTEAEVLPNLGLESRIEAMAGAHGER